jgi:hypothetical protein
MPELLALANMPAIPGLALPYDFYWVLQHPAPLAGMPYPSPRTPWQDLAAAGFQHIICLEGRGPVYDPSPLRVNRRTSLQDLYGGKVPCDPQREARLVKEAAQAVLRTLQAGEGVIVHCAGGTGRTGTVIGCVLHLLGVATGQVSTYLNHLHQARGRAGWPESPWQSQVVRGISETEGMG